MLQARKAAKLSQPQVAEALKVAQSTVAHLEKAAAGSQRTAEYAALYNVDPTWLATGDGEAPGSRTVAAEPAPAGRPLVLTDPAEVDLVLAYRDLLPEDRAAFAKEVTDRAEKMRRHAELVLQRAGLQSKLRNGDSHREE